jgi:hypothetical protein
MYSQISICCILNYNSNNPQTKHLCYSIQIAVFADDEEVLSVVRRAAETVPSICLYVDTAPGTFPPPSKPYLQGMADPAETDGYTMLSFYRFSEISVPEEIAQTLTESHKKNYLI